MFRKKYSIIKNNNNNKCLIIYIVDPLLSNNEKFQHTNQHEIKLLYEVIAKRGYSADVIDFRDKHNIKKMDWKNYKFIITIDDLNLYKVYKYKNKLTKVIYFATGANFLWNNAADISALEKVKKRFAQKGINTDFLRPDRIYNENYIRSINAFVKLNAIWFMGSEWTKSTYQMYDVPTYQINNTGFLFDFSERNVSVNENQKNFLWFGGTGMIHKGLDLCIQAFSKCPEYNLYVAGPKDSYWLLYEKHIKLPNVTYVGFLDVQSEKYLEICNKCIFAILPSCSEGAATSILTVMNMGLIPIVSREAGIDVEKCGFYVDRNVISIEKIMHYTQTLDKQAIIKLSNNAKKYSQVTHSKNAYKTSIKKAMNEMKL